MMAEECHPDLPTKKMQDLPLQGQMTVMRKIKEKKRQEFAPQTKQGAL